MAAFPCSNPSETKSITLYVIKYVKSEYKALSIPNINPAIVKINKLNIKIICPTDIVCFLLITIATDSVPSKHNY